MTAEPTSIESQWPLWAVYVSEWPLKVRELVRAPTASDAAFTIEAQWQIDGHRRNIADVRPATDSDDEEAWLKWGKTYNARSRLHV